MNSLHIPDDESGSGGKPDPLLTRLVLRHAGISNHGWQYELPLDMPVKIFPNDIICVINPVTKEPDFTIQYLVKSIDKDGNIYAVRLEAPEKPVPVIFDKGEVFRVAAAFKSNL